MSQLSGDSRVGQFVTRLNRAERAIGAGCVLVIVSVFFSWISPIGWNGLRSWGLATLLIGVLTLGLLAVRSPYLRDVVAIRPLPLADPIAFVAAGIAEAATAVLCYSAESLPGTHPGVGFYIALAGAALTAFGGYRMLGIPAAERTHAPPPARGARLPTVVPREQAPEPEREADVRLPRIGDQPSAPRIGDQPAAPRRLVGGGPPTALRRKPGDDEQPR